MITKTFSEIKAEELSDICTNWVITYIDAEFTEQIIHKYGKRQMYNIVEQAFKDQPRIDEFCEKYSVHLSSIRLAEDGNKLPELVYKFSDDSWSYSRIGIEESLERYI